MAHTPLYRSQLPRADARRWVRRRATTLVVGLATLAVLGSGLGQGRAAIRETDTGVVDIVSPPSRRGDLIAALRQTPTSPPVAPSVAPSAAPRIAPTVPATNPVLPPGAVPTPTAPTLAALPPTEIRRRATLVEGSSQTGRLEATFDYGDATSTVVMRFDRGDAGLRGAGSQPRRLHAILTYRGATGTRSDKYILIGEQAWRRGAAGRWALAPASPDLWRQLDACLPNLDAATTPVVGSANGGATLGWSDQAADIVLTVDPATGVPQRLRRSERTSNLVLTVAYADWGTPLAINPPEVR